MPATKTRIEPDWQFLQVKHGVSDEFIEQAKRVLDDHFETLAALDDEPPEQEQVKREIDEEDDGEELDPPRPPNPDGSVNVEQLRLFCAICDYLTKAHPGLMCHARQMNAIKDAADLIVAEFRTPIVGASPGMGLGAWLASDDTGLSSICMARTLGPLAGYKRVPGPGLYAAQVGGTALMAGRCSTSSGTASSSRRHLPKSLGSLGWLLPSSYAADSRQGNRTSAPV